MISLRKSRPSPNREEGSVDVARLEAAASKCKCIIQEHQRTGVMGLRVVKEGKA